MSTFSGGKYDSRISDITKMLFKNRATGRYLDNSHNSENIAPLSSYWEKINYLKMKSRHLDESQYRTQEWRMWVKVSI